MLDTIDTGSYSLHTIDTHNTPQQLTINIGSNSFKPLVPTTHHQPITFNNQSLDKMKNCSRKKVLIVMIPFTPQAHKMYRMDSRHKDTGRSYMIKEKVINITF